MNVLNNLKIEPYGYSHGEIIGFRLSGVESGYLIDFNKITVLLEKRKGNTKYNTTRCESEKLIINSGFTHNVTNGEVISIDIKQSNFKTKDYEFGLIRPGHADVSAYQKYGKDWNFSGGGQFSGRLTILYVISGEIAKQILAAKSKIKIIGHVSKVGAISDRANSLEAIYAVQTDPFPMVDSRSKSKASDLLQKQKVKGDSIGGKLDIYVDCVNKPYGDDFFASLEAKISFLLFAIPAVKAIEFGLGVEFANRNGSSVVEKLEVRDGKLMQATNYNGGINGGIANTLTPIKIGLTVKPTSTIFQQVETVRFNGVGFENAKLQMTGRHDAFIANRALWPAIGLLNILFLDLEMSDVR